MFDRVFDNLPRTRDVQTRETRRSVKVICLFLDLLIWRRSSKAADVDRGNIATGPQHTARPDPCKKLASQTRSGCFFFLAEDPRIRSGPLPLYQLAILQQQCMVRLCTMHVHTADPHSVHPQICGVRKLAWETATLDHYLIPVIMRTPPPPP